MMPNSAGESGKRKFGGRFPRRRRNSDPHLLVIEQRIRFKTTAPVSVDAVVSSLHGLERIVQTQLPRAIRSITGTRVQNAKLLVNGLEDGSFIEDLTIQLLFKSKADYEKFLAKTSDAIKAGVEGGTPVLKLAVGIVLGALILKGLGLFPGEGSQNESLSRIEGDNNTVLIVGAQAYGKTPEEIRKALDLAVRGTSPKRAAQAALDATAPAREQGAAIEFEADGESVPIISSATAAALPKRVASVDLSEDEHFSRAKVRLRASDSDSATRGWAGTIPGLVDRRTRIIFANAEDGRKVAFRPEIDAEVTVTYSNKQHDRALLIVIEKVL